MVKNSKNYKNYEIDWNNVRPLPGSWVDEQQKKWLAEGKLAGKLEGKLEAAKCILSFHSDEDIAKLLNLELAVVRALREDSKNDK